MATLYLNEKNRHIILFELNKIIIEKLKTKEINDLLDFFKNKIVEYYNKHFLKDMKVLEKYKLTNEFDTIKLTNHKNVYIVDFYNEIDYWDTNQIYIPLDQKLKIIGSAKIRSEIDDYLIDNYLNEYEKLNDLYSNLISKVKNILFSFKDIIENYRTWNKLTKNHPEFNIIDINKLFPDLNKKKINKKNSDEKLKEATKNIKEFNKLLSEEKK
jgi:hypothetical protein